MPKVDFSPELVAEAVRLREQGLSLVEIAKMLGVSEAPIRRWTRDVVQLRRIRKRKSPDPQLLAKAIGLREQGATVEEIANIIGVSIFTISRWTRDVTRPPRKRKPKPAVSDTDGIFEQANYSANSHNFPGHEERFAGHMKRIRDWLRAHPEQMAGTGS